MAMTRSEGAEVIPLPHGYLTARKTALFERLVGDLRPLLAHLAKEEHRLRMCPLCRCEHVLEPHDADCPYEDARDAVALFDTLSARV